MKKKYSNEYVKKELAKYGYSVGDDFNYQGNTTYFEAYDEAEGHPINLTWKNFNYYVKKGRKKYKPPANDIMNISLSEKEPVHKDSFERWVDKQNDYIKSLNINDQKEAFKFRNDSLKQLLKKKNFTLNFSNNKINELRAFVDAAKTAAPKFGKFDVKLTFIDSNGVPTYRHLNPNTINYLTELYEKTDFDRIKDSLDDYVDNLLDVETLNVEFVERSEGKRHVAEFFPYINKSDIDLTRYGIFKDITHERPSGPELQRSEEFNESCLIQAFKYSKVLNDNELKMLKSFIKTRGVPQTSLRDISNLFKIHINCKKYYDDSGKTGHVDFGEEYKDKRSIKLIIMKNHYLLNERTNVSACYIKRYEEINNDVRFMNHSRKMLLMKFDDKRYSFNKQGMKITKLLTLMIEHKLLEPMTDEEVYKYSWTYKNKEMKYNCACRKVNIKDKKDSYYKQTHKLNQTKHFFGYIPEDDEVDERLNEIQKVIDSLNLRKKINVRLYYKFSELMQKIMYEYGCYDNVYEISGEYAKSIRNKCVFPRTRTFNDKPFYAKQKLYYIDLNGAYMSCVKSIPTGKKGDEEPNTKIKELIEKLYDARVTAKNEGKDKLAKTLKFMMTSCWGYSIQRQKTIKHKYTKNVKEYINTFSPFVLGYNMVDEEQGFVDTVNSFVPHFTIPHFALSVLNEFKKKMDEVKNLVNVYYENVDAILIDEDDYNKLVKLGYIGGEESPLGLFKIEKVFTEIAIKSSKRYVATVENGDKYYHCVKDSVDYDEFIEEVKHM